MNNHSMKNYLHLHRSAKVNARPRLHECYRQVEARAEQTSPNLEYSIDVSLFLSRFNTRGIYIPIVNFRVNFATADVDLPAPTHET